MFWAGKTTNITCFIEDCEGEYLPNTWNGLKKHKRWLIFYSIQNDLFQDLYLPGEEVYPFYFHKTVTSDYWMIKMLGNLFFIEMLYLGNRTTHNTLLQ